MVKRLKTTKGVFLRLLFVLMLTLLFSVVVKSSDTEMGRSSQTFGGFARDLTNDSGEALNATHFDTMPRLILYGIRKDSGIELLGNRKQEEVRGIQFFRVFDAVTEINCDDDKDGFYHCLHVIFDADVDHGDAYVYARMYLSFEGGPWNHYFTTNVFHILNEVSSDDYVVVTRLLDDYPSGYYDVLIELYDAGLNKHAASYGPYEDAALRALPLEDQERDSVGYSDSTGSYHQGGGSIGLIELLMLGVWCVFRFKSL